MTGTTFIYPHALLSCMHSILTPITHTVRNLHREQLMECLRITDRISLTLMSLVTLALLRMDMAFPSVWATLVWTVSYR